MVEAAARGGLGEEVVVVGVGEFWAELWEQVLVDKVIMGVAAELLLVVVVERAEQPDLTFMVV